MLKSTNIFDYIIIGLYFFVMILCGFLLKKLNRDDKDFFKASGKIPWPMASLSIFIGAFSAYMFVAAAGQVYKAGLPAFIIFSSTALGYIFTALFLAGKYRRTRITSPMEYVEMRFGNSTKNIMTYLQIPVFLLLSGNLLYVLCIFISSTFGLKAQFTVLGIQFSGLHIAMIFTGIIIVIYTSIGGLWAVIVTDTVQFIIVMVASVILAVLSFIKFTNGGSFIANFQNYTANPPADGFFYLFNDYQPLSFTIAWIMLGIFSSSGNLPLIQRCACVPNEKDARKSCWLAVVFFIICPIIWLFPVFILREHLPDMASLWPHLKNPTEASYAAIALMLLPNGMIGLVISAMLAASVSSIAGCINIIAVISTNDIYKKISKSATHTKLMAAGKLSSIIAGILTIAIGILLSGFADAFRTTFTLVSHTGLAMALPIVLGLIFRRIPWWSGITAMTLCFTTTLSLEFIIPVLADNFASPIWSDIKSHLFEYKIGGAILVNFAVFSISRLFYKPARTAKESEKLFLLLEKPIDKDSDSAAIIVPNLKAYRVVAAALAIFGVPLGLLKLFRFVDDHRAINLYASLTFLGMSLLIFWLTSRQFSPFKIVRRQS